MDRTIFSIGGINIYWYSVCIIVGIICALFVIRREAKRQNIDKEFITNLAFFTIIIGIIGARIYYCLFNLDYYSNNMLDVFKIWNGGLAIHGGIIAGLITVFVYSKKHNYNSLKIVDIAVVGVILAQAIGRWGNFFNGEAYGTVTTLDNLQRMMIPEFIIKGMYINGEYYTPTFLYESIWCLLGFIVLVIVRRTYKRLHIGGLTALYMIWYGVGRFFIESLRTDSLMIGDFKAAQIVSIILIMVGIAIIIKNATNKSKFDNLYNKVGDINET